jgi:hypothetical protein
MAADQSAPGAAPAVADEPIPTTLRALLACTKGKLAHEPGQAFLLHVFWEAPSAAAGQQLLAALQRCADATHRDTPCVPTYFFRTCPVDQELCPTPPQTVGEHAKLRDARKRLRMGVPAPAVHAGLAKLGIDPALLELDDAAPLPPALRGAQAVRLEFTEVYLDERAFVEHAGSRDFLDGHGAVMNPALMAGVPVTLRLGTPAPGLVERILEPVLRERVAPLPPGCFLWRAPLAGTVRSGEPVLVSLDFDEREPAAVAAAFPPDSLEGVTSWAVFPHALREGTARLLAFAVSLSPALLAAAAALRPARGCVFCSAEREADAASALARTGLASVAVVGPASVAGYPLHAMAESISAKPAPAGQDK